MAHDLHVPPGPGAERTGGATVQRLIGRVSRLEWALAAAAVLVLCGLVVAEPDILEAPFENERTLGLTFGGTIVAAAALAAMLWWGVPPLLRVLVLGVPFVAVSWWTLSPFFVDDVVQDDFEVSIADARERAGTAPSTTAPAAPTATTAPTPPSGAGSPPASPPTAAATAPPPAAAPPPTTAVATAPPPSAAPAPRLLGAGSFVGLAGHDGTGDAGIFELADASRVLRLENLDIDNGPDLRLYLLPGADQTVPGPDGLYLGPLRGNVGNLSYDLPADFAVPPGAWTVLVWCEAFSVEFVGATLTVA